MIVFQNIYVLNSLRQRQKYTQPVTSIELLGTT